MARKPASDVLMGIVLTPDIAFGLPYEGAFNPLSVAGPDGLYSAAKQAIAVATLNAAQAALAHMMTNLNDTRATYQNPTADAFNVPGALIGSLNLESWKQRLLMLSQHIDLTAYITDKTVLCANAFDEPQDGGKVGDKSGWGGKPVPYADAKAGLLYHKQIYPHLPVGMQTTTAWLLAAPGGASYWKGALDWCIVNYAWKDGQTADPTVWFPPIEAAAAALGVSLLVNINCLSGTTGLNPITAGQLNTWGTYFLGQAKCAGLVLYRWGAVGPNEVPWTQADYAAVVVSLIAQAKARGKTGIVGAF